MKLLIYLRRKRGSTVFVNLGFKDCVARKNILRDGIYLGK